MVHCSLFVGNMGSDIFPDLQGNVTSRKGKNLLNGKVSKRLVKLSEELRS